jgi:hypothetical protein
MICDIQNYNNPIQNTDVINYYNPIILKGDIEEGLGEYDVYDRCVQIPKMCKSNYLVFELISNISNMSYKIMKNMKQIVSNQFHYLCPSSIKKQMENYL